MSVDLGLGVRVVGPLDHDAAWDGTDLVTPADLAGGGTALDALRGAVTGVLRHDTGWWIVRDPLGINKLFWVRDRGGDVVLSARPHRLVRAGYALDSIAAIPSGALVDLLDDGTVSERSLVPARWYTDPREEDVDAVGRRIGATLEAYLQALARRVGPAEVFVCLSGGLDSSGIASLVAEVFPSAIAVSFDLGGPGRSVSEDRRAGERVARELGLPLLDVTVTEEQLLDHLDTVLLDGIDWRDFNVHAGLVNAALAHAIADVCGRRDDGATLVVTGDLANEFLVDYEAETYLGRTYYTLPRLRPTALRASLVRGLDTSHREIGVFEAFGLRVVQPYAVAVDDYLSLPEAFLERADRKQTLCRAVFGGRIPEHVYGRTKVRAQVGSSSDGGVLRVCVDRGIDDRWLRRRFADLHEVDDPSTLDRFIRAGRYRSRIPADGGR